MRHHLGLSVFLCILLALVLLIGASAGCRRDDRHSDDGANAVTKLRVGYIPVTHCLPLYVAIEQGYFAKERIEVELIPLAGGATILEALAAREVDIGFSNVVSPILARSQGLPFVAFTGGPVEDSEHKDHAIMVRADSAIDNVAALRGMKIAINTRRAIDHLMILLLLRKNGLSENDVTLVEVPFPRMLGALSSNAVDAIATAEPFITLGIQAETARVLVWNYVEVRPETYVSTYVANENFLRDKADVVERFKRALAAGTEKVRNDPQLSREVLTQFTSLTPDVASKVGLPRFEPELDRANLLETLQELRATGILEQDVNLSDVLAKEVP